MQILEKIQEILALNVPSKRIILETVCFTPFFTMLGTLFLSMLSMTGTLMGAVDPGFLIYVLITAPLFEELVFRGAAWWGLSKFLPEWAVVYITGTTFLLIHFNLSAFIGLMPLVGWISYLRIKTNSLIPCVVAHMTNNVLAVIALWIAAVVI
jgi:membrane protease YdiL (CAAX protease family)